MLFTSGHERSNFSTSTLNWIYSTHKMLSWMLSLHRRTLYLSHEPSASGDEHTSPGIEFWYWNVRSIDVWRHIVVRIDLLILINFRWSGHFRPIPVNVQWNLLVTSEWKRTQWTSFFFRVCFVSHFFFFAVFFFCFRRMSVFFCVACLSISYCCARGSRFVSGRFFYCSMVFFS